MATYNQVSYGSQGSEVKTLQELLNKNGAKLTVDGIFGNQTQEAVKNYQKQKGLAVDGIVGKNTWGALTTVDAAGASTTETPAQPTTPAAEPWSYEEFQASQATMDADKKRQEIASQKPGDFTYSELEKSDVVKQAEAMLQQHLSQKPGAYQSAWQTQLDDTLNKILNREKFSYDLNGDALYQQYKDQYMLQGQQAMMDTMGQAQTMTGGYGNSYAQQAGQQTYQGHLQQLNDRVPELYQLALDQYNREGEDLYNQYGLYADREDQDYGRYRDSVSDYYTELDRLTEDARYKAEDEYNKWTDKTNLDLGIHRDEVSDWQQEQARADEEYWNQYSKDYGQWQDKTELDYGIHRDTIADQHWQKSFDEGVRQYDESLKYQQDRDKVDDEHWQKTFDEGVRQFNKEYSLDMAKEGLTDGDDDKVVSNGITRGQVKEMQAWYGTEADGVWGKNSTSAAGGRTVEEAWDNYTKLKELLSPAEAQMVIRGDRNEIVEHFRNEYLNLRKLLNADSSLQRGEAQRELDSYLKELMEAGVLLKYEDLDIRDSRS